MGRRELIIALVFVVLAVVAYQLTAAPLKEGEEGFSLSRFFSGIRKEIRSHNATGSITRAGTVKLRDEVTEVRLTVSRSFPITVTGEDRKDLAYELSVQSNGPDEAAARALADQTKFGPDDLGSAIALKLTFPEPGEQTAKLNLRVPERLLVRFEGAGRAVAAGVRAVEMRNLAGETTFSKVRDLVKGTHRQGDLKISLAGAVDVSMTTSSLHLDQIAGPISLNGRNGSCTISASTGTIDASVTNVELGILEHGGSIRVTGDGSMLKVVQPAKELSVDVRRMHVEIALAAAIPATVITTDGPIKILFTSTPAATIDAVLSERGEIKATDIGLAPVRADREWRLSGAVGAGGPRMLLRNTRGDIVIGVRK